MEGDSNKARWWAIAATLLAVALLLAPASASARKPKVKITDAPPVTEAAPGPVPQHFKVSLSRKLTHRVTFDFATYDGSAETDFLDYADTAGSGQINAGRLSTKVTVQVDDDFEAEPKEAYGVAISNVHGAKLSARRNANGFIKDNEPHEAEPNNVFATANLVSENSNIGAHFSLSDTDFFKFVSSSNGSIVAYTGAYGDFSCPPGPGQIDTILTAYDSSHSQLATDDDHNPLCSQVSFPISMGATYYLKVTDGATPLGSIFDYKLTTFII